MLTKDLLQATVRNGKLYPKFIDAQDAQVTADVKSLIESFSQASGRQMGELEDEVKSVATTPRRKAIAKILLDQCEVIEPSEEIIEVRWRMFALSEQLRKNRHTHAVDFFTAISRELDEPLEELRQKIFSDLPNARTVKAYLPLTESEVIDRYNLSHVLTFLCLAEDVVVTVMDCSIGQKREIMRRLKFHRLMSDVDIDKDANSMKMELSGPLRLFGKTQGYALRVANFFPFVASLPRWSLEAVVKWKNKKVRFVLDETSKIKTKSTRSQGGFVPPEFDQVIKALNRSGELKVESGGDFMNIGSQSYCFPDLIVKHSDKTLGIELFHAWHRGQLKSRLEIAEKSRIQNLLIGVDRSLLKDEDIRKLCEVSAWFQKFGFEYSQFPTPQVLKRAVAKHV
jgi:hypothetical protein